MRWSRGTTLSSLLLLSASLLACDDTTPRAGDAGSTTLDQALRDGTPADTQGTVGETSTPDLEPASDLSPGVDVAADGPAGDGGPAADGAVPSAAYAAQPPAGTLYWGAAIGGNGDPVVRHEAPSGHTLVIRRTFFQWTQRTGYLVNVAQGDLAAGRLPWVSVKTPSWADMAAGLYDSEIDAMLKALAALPGPVWLTVHHEPEGGGGVNQPDDPAGPAGHLGMNQRVRARMTALKVTNVALAPILMSWTWDPASKRDPDQWWAPGIYDFLGVDHYRDSEASLLTSTWAKVRAWASAKGVDVAVGEWGMRGTDQAAGQRVHAWYDAAAGSHADGQGARVVGLCAFDSGLNSPTGSWELKGEQLTAFWALLKDPRTMDWPSLP